MAQKSHFAILRIEVTHASRGLSAIAELLVIARLNSRILFFQTRKSLLVVSRLRLAHVDLRTRYLPVATWSTQPCFPPGSLNRVPASAGGKGWNVTSAGWQVTLCDPIWHVSSSSGVATSVSELLYPCYLTYLLYFTYVASTEATRVNCD